MTEYLDHRGEPLLRVDDLHVEFVAGKRTVRAVQGVSYEIWPGETLSLVGESGSGKTVSALSLIGLLPGKVSRVTGGSAHFEDHDLLGMSERELRKVRGARIGMIFQDPLSSLNPVLPIGRQITEGIQKHTALGGRAARARAIDLLDLVGIPSPAERYKEYPHQFSGGMRQRAMIAMAISCDPTLLIADEPTTALDVTIQAQILDLLSELRSELGMAILFITHDLGAVAGLADRLAVMYAGRLVEIGPTEEIYTRPAHPYTVGLLHSLPRIDGPRDIALTPIGGTPPDTSEDIVGCPFEPRCAWSTEVCASIKPELGPVSGAGIGSDSSRLVACHNPPTFEESLAGHPLELSLKHATEPGTPDTTGSAST